MTKSKKPWPPERVYVVHPPRRKMLGGWTPRAFLAYPKEADTVNNRHGGTWGVAEYVHSDFEDPNRLPPDDPRADEGPLYELRQAIDDHLGWRNEREEEAGDYVARIKQVARILKRYREKAIAKPARKVAKRTVKLGGVDIPVGTRVRLLNQGPGGLPNGDYAAGTMRPLKPLKRPKRKVAKRARKAKR